MPLVYCQRKYSFYIGSIADNNQKMKGKKDERKNGRGKEPKEKGNASPCRWCIARENIPFYIGSIADNNQKMKENIPFYRGNADNNQKMKGRKEEGKKSKQTVGCNFKSLNLPMCQLAQGQDCPLRR